MVVKLRKVYLSPQEVEPLPETVEAIMDADLIVFGPGSLYTSILPTILVRAIREAVLACTAKKVYICNLDNTSRRNIRYTASEHVQALYDHAGEAFIDTVLLNDGDIKRSLTKESMMDLHGQLNMIWKSLNNLYRIL